MHIVNFQADNYKRLKAVNITPDGRIIQITGKNRQGKTSILDGIWAALVGGEASRATSQPIREGEKQATLRVDLGEYVVTRRFNKNDGGTLTVESPRGAKYSSPQALLDQLVGRAAMDPLSFIRQSDKQQVSTLVGLLGDSLGFDPEELERDRATVFDARTAVNREVKRLAAVLDGMPEAPSHTPVEELSVSELVREGGRIRKHNEDGEELKREAQRAVQRLETARLKLEQVRVQLIALELEESDAAERAEHHQLAADGFEPRDESAVLEKLASVDETNANVRARKARESTEQQLAGHQAAAEKLSAELDDIAKRKADGLASAKLPLEGLSFDETGVLYNGVPLSQASSAEKRIVSFALAIASHPELRVIRMDEGESLDSEALAHIAELAEEHDYQVWISRVDETGTTGVVIEDGMVKE